MIPNRFIADLLIKAGVVDRAAITQVAEAQQKNCATLGRALAGLGLADEAVVATAIAAALRLDYVDAQATDPGSSVAKLLPAEFCRKRRVAPVRLEGNVLTLAVADPMDDAVVQDVRFRTGKNTIAVVATETGLEELFGRMYPELKADDQANAYNILQGVNPSGEVEASGENEYELIDPEALAKDTKLPPIVRLVNLLLSDAAAAGASDVHIEPQETQLQVRHRVDGQLRDVLAIPAHLKDQTISRLKIISGMDIAERRKPQDGRSRLKFDGRRIDLRVSTLPTQFGEKIVIRLLNSDRGIQPLDQIGLSPDNLKTMRKFLSHPQGLVLVTGPTGSGKTSTLYTALKSIKSSSNNIITLEDPIELQLPGVNQIQINAKAGLTFTTGLRSILRQDPNVILVGEIRDHETADIALQAAQTGHLLLSTLHTNDAPSTLTRLFDLGIQPFLVASSILGIVAQRLVRRPCPACAVAERPSDETIERAGGAARLPANGQWVAAKGCPACLDTGYKGRIAIHEILDVNDEVRALIAERAPEQVIKKAGRRGGMRTLFEDGVEKASQGLTTLDEVLRTVSLDEADEAPRRKRDAAIAAAVESLAAAAAAAAPMAAAPAPVDAAPPAAAAPNAIDAGRPRVLVVEDSPTVSSVVKYFLELEGFEVLLAADGEIGLETARREHPRVIVSDVSMPRMTGIEMVRALRGDAATADIRILMLTSEGSIESETDGLAAGADDYILKPVEPRRLSARVKALLARARPGQAA
jgi:type II secretory ATPase GspE/PulE/Tfp pilus assembly ATPase PilB-like protein/ActR/RegA family two-component response regulator